MRPAGGVEPVLLLGHRALLGDAPDKHLECQTNRPGQAPAR
eukprot:XP_001708964.1 Hypothetical protein GL50803_39396 [Giardia lamblia ATCC 50803]